MNTTTEGMARRPRLVSLLERMVTVLALAGTAAISCAAGAGPESVHRPNFILVLVDDMGWGDPGCFGNTEARTPAMDRVAEEGIRFRQFYVAASVCSPSRCGLLTGQYPQRWRIHSYLGERDRNRARGMADWLDPQAPVLAKTLQAAGYATGHFGKWHLGGQRDVGEAPLIQAYGFDESLTNFEGLGPRVLGLCYGADGKLSQRQSLGSDKLGHGPIEWVDRSKITARYVERALGFIKDARSAGKPFYINVWPDDVHSPFYPPPDRRGDGSKKALYRGVLETMDMQLAPLFDAVRNDPGLAADTLVILCSDNGPEQGAGSPGPFRGGKQTLYEGGIRSPLIVWGPGFLPRDRYGTWNESSIVSAIDLAPSLLALAKVAGTQGAVSDGEALPEVLTGTSQDGRSGALYFRLAPDGQKNTPKLAVREGNWKLLCMADGSGKELYDLASDPGETTNLAPQHPELCDRFARQLEDWNRMLPPASAARDRSN